MGRDAFGCWEPPSSFFAALLGLEKLVLQIQWQAKDLSSSLIVFHRLWQIGCIMRAQARKFHIIRSKDRTGCDYSHFRLYGLFSEAFSPRSRRSEKAYSGKMGNSTSREQIQQENAAANSTPDSPQRTLEPMAFANSRLQSELLIESVFTGPLRGFHFYEKKKNKYFSYSCFKHTSIWYGYHQASL